MDESTVQLVTIVKALRQLVITTRLVEFRVMQFTIDLQHILLDYICFRLIPMRQNHSSKQTTTTIYQCNKRLTCVKLEWQPNQH